MSSRVQVGKCPTCGIVTGDEIDYRFPNPCECTNCGDQLEKTKFVRKERLEQLQ